LSCVAILIGDIGEKTSDDLSPIGVTVGAVDTVTGLPSGLTFDSTNNTISGTPINIGTSTITIVSTDASGNKTTTTFKPDVLVEALCESALLVDTLCDCWVLPDVDTESLILFLVTSYLKVVNK
jgi:hypothetical protein